MASEFEEVGVEAVVKGFEAFLLKLEVMNAAIAASGTVSIASAIGVVALGLAFGAVALAVTGVLAGIGLLVGGFFALSLASFNVARSVETAFAGVAKTTNGLTDEFGKMNDTGKEVLNQFRELSKEVPLALEELLRIGELAGQLGIAKESLAGFSEVVAALAVTTDLTVEKATLGLARIANIYEVSANDMVLNTEKVGSALVFLGNNFATTEGEILDFAKRIAGVAKIAGISQTEILGIGAAFTSVGIEAQAGGTAVQTVIIEMTKAAAQGGEEMELFAEVSGKTNEQFVEDWNSDAAGAFDDFVQGLGDSGNDAFTILEDLGVADRRIIRAFLAVAGAGDLMTDSIDGATDAFDKNTALMREATIRYATFDSQMQIFKNIIRDIGLDIGLILLPAMTNLLKIIEPIVEAIGKGLVPAFENIYDALTTSLLPAFGRLIDAFGFDITGADLTQGIINFGDTIAGGIEAFADFVDVVADLVDLYQEGGIVSVAEHFGIKKDTAQLFLDVGSAVLIATGAFIGLNSALAIIAGISTTIGILAFNFGELGAAISLLGGGAGITAVLGALGISIGAVLIGALAALVGVFIIFGERAEIAAGQLLGIILIKFLEWKNKVVLLWEIMWTAIQTNTVQSISDWEDNVNAWWQRTLDGIGIWVENMKTTMANMWVAIQANTIASKDKFLAELEALRASAVEKMVAFGVEAIQVHIDWWRDMIATLNAKGAEWGVAIGTWIVNMAAKLREGISGWLQAGKDMMNGLLEGLKANVGKVIDWIKEISKNFITAVMDAVGGHSPSTEFADIGKYMMQGLAEGIVDNADLPQVALDAAAASMISAENQTMRGIGAGAGSIDNSTSYNVNANYTETQSPGSIADTLSLAAMLAGAN